MAKDRSRGRTKLRPAADADSFFGGSSRAGGKAERKERMLCRQVQEAVSEALAAIDDEVLLDLWVVDVREAPGAGRLIVMVAGAKSVASDEVRARLERVAGHLRAEVASAITRKRVPTLAFELAPDPEGSRDGEPLRVHGGPHGRRPRSGARAAGAHRGRRPHRRSCPTHTSPTRCASEPSRPRRGRCCRRPSAETSVAAWSRFACRLTRSCWRTGSAQHGCSPSSTAGSRGRRTRWRPRRRCPTSWLRSRSARRAWRRSSGATAAWRRGTLGRGNHFLEVQRDEEGCCGSCATAARGRWGRRSAATMSPRGTRGPIRAPDLTPQPPSPSVGLSSFGRTTSLRARGAPNVVLPPLPCRGLSFGPLPPCSLRARGAPNVVLPPSLLLGSVLWTIPSLLPAGEGGSERGGPPLSLGRGSRPLRPSPPCSCG